MSAKDWRKVLEAAEAQGWRCETTKNGHWRLYAPDDVNIVHASGTPSDYRALTNTIAKMRHYGFIWKGH